jgi:DNA-binding SARP family transcriptional activator/pimeloyl-ACP methyl ester carboxylesterase
MEFRVLGPLEVFADGGASVPVPGRRQRALLAALLAAGGRPVAADTLVELLWGASAPADPAAALHSQVSRLRRALSPAGERVRTTPAGYVLALEPGELDAGRFEALLRDGELDAALALWRGPAYEEFADVAPARLEGLRLDELRVEVAEQRAERRLDREGPESAIGELEVLVAAHPLHERPLALLMRALHAAGRQPDALARYEDYRRHLGAELGLEPSAALRALHDGVLRDEDRAPATGLARLQVRYVEVGGRRLALGTVGSGPPLVVPPAWLSSLDVIAAGRDPRSTLLERLAGERTVTLYDRAGTGLSAGAVDDFSLAAAAAELEAVLERTGTALPVLAISQAVPPAVTVAARRPDLVARLVCCGGYVRGEGVFADPALQESIVAMVRAHWGLAASLLAGLYRPGAGEDATAHLARVLRDSAPADIAAGYLEAVYAADATAAAGEVRAPALVIHYRADRVIPFAGAQQLATGLPDARLLILDGGYHMPDAADLPRVLDAIREFLGGEGA